MLFHGVFGIHVLVTCSSLTKVELFIFAFMVMVELGCDQRALLCPNTLEAKISFGSRCLVRKHDVRLKVDLHKIWKLCPCIGMYSRFRSCISTLLFRLCQEKPSCYPQTKHHNMQSHFHPCCIFKL